MQATIKDLMNVAAYTSLGRGMMSDALDVKATMESVREKLVRLYQESNLTTPPCLEPEFQPSATNIDAAIRCVFLGSYQPTKRVRAHNAYARYTPWRRGNTQMQLLDPECPICFSGDQDLVAPNEWVLINCEQTHFMCRTCAQLYFDEQKNIACPSCMTEAFDREYRAANAPGQAAAPDPWLQGELERQHHRAEQAARLLWNDEVHNTRLMFVLAAISTGLFVVHDRSYDGEPLVPIPGLPRFDIAPRHFGVLLQLHMLTMVFLLYYTLLRYRGYFR